MDAQVYFLDTRELCPESLTEEEKAERIRRLSAGLSEERRRKIESRRQTAGKLLSLGVGLLTDYGLRQRGLRERDAAMIYGERQKPYLRDHPQIFFNLSHSGTMAMAAFADRETGCDVERMRTPDHRVARRFFAPEEARLLEIAAEEERRERFYRIWTLKESFIKATGEGIHRPLAEFSILWDAGDRGKMEGPIRVVSHGETLPYRFREFSLPGCRAALCLLGEEEEGEPEARTIRGTELLAMAGV